MRSLFIVAAFLSNYVFSLRQQQRRMLLKVPIIDKHLTDYFYLNLKVREKKKYKKQSKYTVKCSKTHGRDSFKRYFKGELHYLDEFNFYGLLYLKTCNVRFDCNWGHVRAGTWHSADVVGEKDGKPVVFVTSWKSQYRLGQIGPFRCKGFELSDVFVFNPKYSYSKKRPDKVDDVVRKLIFFRRVKNSKLTISSLKSVGLVCGVGRSREISFWH